MDRPAADSPAASIVVPTYREAPNLPLLTERLADLRAASELDFELLVMDDDSRDGTEEWAAEHAPDWCTLVVRKEDRGLSQAVLDGLRRARGDALVVMDADLSHPPEAVPDLLRALDDGADLVLGSRYVADGSTSDDWGLLRYVNSKVATWLARPFTSVRDPMSGFIALRRETFERGRSLNPIGYKIGLELIVKCRCSDVREVPIHFSQRQHGESKLTLAEQARYLGHLARLARFKLFSS